MDLRGHGESEGDNSLINDIDHLDMDFLLFQEKVLLDFNPK